MLLLGKNANFAPILKNIIITASTISWHKRNCPSRIVLVKKKLFDSQHVEFVEKWRCRTQTCISRVENYHQ